MVLHTQQSRPIACFTALARSVSRQHRLPYIHCRAHSAVGSARSSYLGQSLHVQGSRLQRQQQRPSGVRSKVILAAIFGVGAPEALLVGVVALVVFGPKGLAQAVKSLGATLKTFSPTIRELASVTNELSSTLQEQIGLDDIRNEFRNPSPTYTKATEPEKPSTSSSSAEGSQDGKDSQGSSKSQDGIETVSSPEVAEIPSRVLEAQIEESKKLAWGGKVPDLPAAATAEPDMPQLPSEVGFAPTPEVVEKPASKATPETPSKVASDLSMEELEAELNRRRNAAASK